MAQRVKEEAMVSKFKNLLDKLSETDAITTDNQELYIKEIEENQEWLSKNYNDILDFLGIEQSTSKLIFLKNLFTKGF